MKYSELPAWLQEKVRANTIAEYGESFFNEGVFEELSIGALFTWRYSPEGHFFWAEINSGNIPEQPTP